VVSTAEEIVQGDMARRVPVRGGGDEFDRLAGTLNRMLDRIQLLVADLRMVTDGVAHDLRSPLTRLRAHLDASLEDGLDEPARRERIGRAIAEAEAVLRTFAALMEIARAEAGVGRDQFEPIALGGLADDVIDLYTPTAAEKGVRLVRAGEGAIVAGHPQLLANAVANLVENAVAHAREGSEVTVALEDGSAPALTVADRGPGIPDDARERVLQRFVRLDASRGRPGAGLGLSLVAAVARLHDAALELADNAPGLRATLRFAAVAPEDGPDEIEAPARDNLPGWSGAGLRPAPGG
jgi:signal transduction histidine kinase